MLCFLTTWYPDLAQRWDLQYFDLSSTNLVSYLSLFLFKLLLFSLASCHAFCKLTPFDIQVFLYLFHFNLFLEE